MKHAEKKMKFECDLFPRHVFHTFVQNLSEQTVWGFGSGQNSDAAYFRPLEVHRTNIWARRSIVKDDILDNKIDPASSSANCECAYILLEQKERLSCNGVLCKCPSGGIM